MFRRRTFLTGLVALPVASAFPIRNRPVLWGDGIHDDQPAFQAIVDGDNDIVAMPGSHVAWRDGRWTADGGTYRLGEYLDLGGPGSLTIINSDFIGPGIRRA